MARTHPFALALLVSVVMSSSSFAAVTDVRLYHLGESDPGALPLNPGNPVTVDSAAGVNASKVGLTFYNGTSSVGPPVGVGLAPGSSMSMRFTNVDSRYQASAVTGLTDNFGLEAYILATTPAYARPFYNGGDGTPLDTLGNGAGLGIVAGQYQALVGSTTIPTGVPVVPGTPVEMALVVHGGTFDVYVNDVLKNSIAFASYVPATATDMLSIGNFDATPSTYAGVVDEARVFTFAPGGFNASTDLGGAAVPEPASIALALLALVPARKQRRSA